MKKIKIMNVLSYVVLTISTVTLVLSLLCMGFKNSVYYDEKTYFSSDTFVCSYMLTLTNLTSVLIHNKEEYTCKQDGDMKIYYMYNYYSENNTIYMNSTEIKDMCFLIIYKNHALTNVDADTIDEIRQYITSKEDAKHLSILDGKISAESGALEQYGPKYLTEFSIPYYTTDTEKKDKQLSDGRYIEYIYPQIQDFRIYSSYTEQLYLSNDRQIISEFFNKIAPFERNTYVIFPISLITTILVMLYLIITIGHSKNKKEIELNDFDKIPLEIILFVAILICCIPFIPLATGNMEHRTVVSLLVTAYLTIYVFTIIILNTLIKRIKSKTLAKTSLIGLMTSFIIKMCKKFLSKIKDVYDTVLYSANATARVIIVTGIIIAIWAIIVGLFANTGMFPFIIILLVGFIMYKVIQILKEFSQVENKLKEIYEGNNQNELDFEKFTPCFKKSVKYLNDISNGFETAIQDRMKSEKFKTELITNVSHDIKTPLTSIINYTDLLKKEDIDNEKAKEYINILDIKSQRLKKLTEDLIEASKVSTGNISLKMEKINVVELTKQALGEFEDKFNKCGLEIILDVKKSEMNIMADSRYMYRIIENLFSNVSKYALENSRVYIDITNKDNKMFFEIKNISKNRLNISAEELMQRFVRGDKSRTTEGSGLGLSIAQNLTELQKGKFNLKLDGDLFKVELIFDII